MVALTPFGAPGTVASSRLPGQPVHTVGFVGRGPLVAALDPFTRCRGCAASRLRAPTGVHGVP
jgi:hypothetical protein